MDKIDEIILLFKNADSLAKESRFAEAIDYLEQKLLGYDDYTCKQLILWKIKKIEEKGAKSVQIKEEFSYGTTVNYQKIAFVILSLILNKKLQSYDELIIQACFHLNDILRERTNPWQIEVVIEELKKYRLIKGTPFQITERGKKYLLSIKSLEGELCPEEAEVLSVLEKKESELINSGLYETCITSKNLSSEIADKTDEEVTNILKSLVTKGYVMKVGEGYRSRIAEIVRLLYLVRQRFSSGGRSRRPRLVRSVKLKIVPRKIPLFNINIENLILYLKRIIKNSAVWPEYEHVWDKGVKIFSNFLYNIGITFVSGFQFRGILSIFQDLLNLEAGQKEKAGKVLVAGTGTGKTETFLLPHFLLLILRKLSRKKRETLLFCIYPRVRLAVNQLERMLTYSMEINKELAKHGVDGISIGMMNQYVPKGWEDLISSKYSRQFTEEKKSLKLIQCPKLLRSEKLNLKFKCNSDLIINHGGTTLICSEGHFVPYVFTRELQAKNPPDIMIITPESLHRCLMQNQYNDFFRGSTKTFVIDEIHIYEAIHGSQMALLIRRALKKIKELGASTMIIGSSATLAVPSKTFKDLTSVHVTENDIIIPAEDELVESGVEYFIFVRPETVSLVETNRNLSGGLEDSSEVEIEERRVSPFSTLIQTLMCVMHNARKRWDKYKAIGFIDSVDSLYSWKIRQEDAENNELFNIRIKPDMKKEGVNLNCNDCQTSPNVKCPLFIEGECWWFPRFDKDQFKWDQPLNLAQVSSVEEIDFESDWDVVLSTSSLEVGFDDPRIIAILQYKTPHTLASFLQRKGRGARNPEERPITVLVLNPYSSQDLYYFTNPERLIEGEIRETPLNPENYFAQRAHFCSAVFDMLSTISPMDYYYIDYSSLQALESELKQREQDILKWNNDVFRDVGKIYNRYYNHNRFIRNIIDSIKWGLKEGERPKNVPDLSDFIPKTMFEDLNVPYVRVGNNPTENIVEAMRTLIPGNPTNKYRLADESSNTYWCPVQSLSKNSSVLWINPNDCYRIDQLDINAAPVSLRPFFKGQKYIDILRPKKIIIQAIRRTKGGRLSAIYCPKCKQIFRRSYHQHPIEVVLDTTKAYPVEFTYLKEKGEGKSFRNIKKHYTLFGLEGIVTDHVYYYGYGKGLAVYKVYLASQVFLKTAKGYKVNSYSPVNVSFHKPNGDPVFYGYSLDTEGFAVFIDDEKLENLIGDIPEQLLEELRRQFFLYLLMSEAIGNPDFNVYQATKVGKILSTLWSLIGKRIDNILKSLPKGEDLIRTVQANVEKFEQFVSKNPFSVPNLEDGVSALCFIRTRFYKHMPKIDWEEFLKILATDEARELIIGKLRKSFSNEELIKYCKDVFTHSLKHIFQRAAVIVGGVSENDIGGILKPNVEFGQGESIFYIYEMQEGGNGATRTIQNRVVNLPGEAVGKDLMALVDDFSSYCPTGDVEDILNAKIFNLSENVIQDIRGAIAEASRGNMEILETKLQEILKIRPTKEILAKIIEIFTQKSIGGELIDDYSLYKEIWTVKKITEYLLKRTVTHDELQSTIYIIIKNKREIPIKPELSSKLECKCDKVSFPNLHKLWNLLQDEKIFWEEIRKRSLSSCQNTCPECLSTSCTYFNLLISDLMLNRHLVKTVLLKVKEDFTVRIEDPKFEEKLNNLLKTKRFAYVRFNPQQTSIVIQKIGEILAKSEYVPYIREVKPIITREESFQELLIHIGE